MIAEFFTTIGSVISGFATCVQSAASSVISIFYTTGSNAGLTPLGQLLLIAVGTGLVFWAFGLIKSLIKRA
ncbi:MAG: hypothetical protein MJ191_06875 [Clostridium sp.]|nr:hypothetical protein [Clostridium sp.]